MLHRANNLASPNSLHQITLYSGYMCVYVSWQGRACFRLSVSSCQQGDCSSLHRHSKERLGEERKGNKERGERGVEASPGHRSRQNDEVKGEVSLVPDLWTRRSHLIFCQRLQKGLVSLL